MAKFSMLFAIFTLVIVIADIIMALTLCFSLPYHASRLHFYPPYGRIVDIDTATIHCPCLHKYLEEFRGKIDVKFVKPPKDDRGHSSKLIKQRKIERLVNQTYPYLATVIYNNNHTCHGYVTTSGEIVISARCGNIETLGAIVRTAWGFKDKIGQFHKITYKQTLHGLKYFIPKPVIPNAKLKGIHTDRSPFFSFSSDNDFMAVHIYNTTTKVYRSEFFRMNRLCYNQQPMTYCPHLFNKYHKDHSKRNPGFAVLINQCTMNTIGSMFIYPGKPLRRDEGCVQIYKGSCMTPTEEESYCKKKKSKSL